MLGLPGAFYDKYDRVVKGCRMQHFTSVPRPPRARIAGLRASSFGGLIFVDHEEIKLGHNAYLAFAIIDGAFCGLRPEAPETQKTIVFQKESLEIKLSSLILHG